MSRLVKQEGASPGTGSPSAAPSPLLESGPFTNYRLVAASNETIEGWKHNVMKFNAVGKDNVINPSASEFVKPVKLNRKDPRAVRRLTEEEAAKLKKQQYGGDAMEVDSKDGVKGEDGASTPADEKKKEREEIDLTLVGKGVTGNTPAVRSKQTMFKKKTKRVFVSSEEARRLKREEWMPWVLRDDEGNNQWIGRLEGGAGEVGGSSQSDDKGKEKSGTSTKGWRPAAATGEAGGGGSSYVAFVFSESGEDFEVVPINRWYRFSREPKYATLDTEEADAEYNRQQKAQDAERWLMHKRPGDTRATAGSATASGSSSAPSSTRNAGPSANSAIRIRLLDKSTASGRPKDGGPNRRLRSVIKGSSGGGGDDEIGRGRGRERGGEQDDDEFDYEEDFQDDEEGIAKIDDLADEEETKELEERIKKEMRGANNFEDNPDDDEDEDTKPSLTNTGKEVKKLVKKADKGGLYDSDNEDDENPYASESEYDDEEASVASLDLNEKDSTRSGTTTPLSRPRPSTTNRARPSSHAGSRSGSPAPGTSGSAVIARRATSPHTGGGKRSPSASRASSPGAGGGGSKRKRMEEMEDGTKRRKNDEALLTESDLIAFLRTGTSFSTKEVLAHFRKELKEARNKAIIGALLQAVANLTNGILVLKPEHRQ